MLAQEGLNKRKVYFTGLNQKSTDKSKQRIYAESFVIVVVRLLLVMRYPDRKRMRLTNFFQDTCYWMPRLENCTGRLLFLF